MLMLSAWNWLQRTARVTRRNTQALDDVGAVRKACQLDQDLERGLPMLGQ